jgi:hypothetical protein
MRRHRTVSDTRRHSTIEALPDDLQDTIRALVLDNKFSYSQITEHVRALGADVSRSAIARYGRHVQAQQAQLEAARDMARELLKVGDGMDLAELASRLVAVKLLSVLMQNDIYLDDEGLGLPALVAIARTVAALQSTALAKAKYDDERRAQSDDTAAKAARGGLSQETVNAIKQRVLGITGEASP